MHANTHCYTGVVAEHLVLHCDRTPKTGSLLGCVIRGLQAWIREKRVARAKRVTPSCSRSQYITKPPTGGVSVAGSCAAPCHPRSVLLDDSMNQDMKPASRFSKCARASCILTCDMPLSIPILGLPMAKLKFSTWQPRVDLMAKAVPDLREGKEQPPTLLFFSPKNMESIHQTPWTCPKSTSFICYWSRLSQNIGNAAHGVFGMG